MFRIPISLANLYQVSTLCQNRYINDSDEDMLVIPYGEGILDKNCVLAVNLQKY